MTPTQRHHEDCPLRTSNPTVVLALVTLTAMILVPAGGATGDERAFGDSRLFARVPRPGTPEGIVVRDGVVYVGTHAGFAPNAGDQPSKLFRYKLDDGALLGDITVAGQNLRATHGVLALAFGPDGRLYAVDRNPPRLLAFDLSTSPPAQETYTTIPTLDACRSTPCTPGTLDQPPVPDGLAFDRVGRAYVTDVDNGTIFRVAPGGGAAEIWFQDARIDGVVGPNGITLDPTGTRLFFAVSSSTSPTAIGAVDSLPVIDHPAASDLRTFHEYVEPGALPDGIAFDHSQAVYVTLGGIDQLSVLNPQGTELHRFPNPVDNQQRDVPFDNPANIDFDGHGSLLVANQAFFSQRQDHWAVLAVWVNDKS